MPVISVLITESPVQKVYGIPISITLSTNIPATIFYTLDGSDPTILSDVVTGPITLPDDQMTVIFKYFATNGIDDTPILDREYKTNLTDFNIRKPRSKVEGIDNTCGTCENKSPLLGGGSTNGSPYYYGIGAEIVNNELIPGEYNGYDGYGSPTGKTDKEWSLENYEIIFSETNRIGERGKGIGTLPGHVTLIDQEKPVPLTSDANSPFFDPRALVIIHDGTQEPYDPDHPIILRHNYSAYSDVVRYGRDYFTPAHEGTNNTGSMLVPKYDYRNGTVTFYYRDKESNRWIISTEKFKPNAKTMNFSSIVFGRENGSRYIFNWKANYFRKLW